MYMLIGCKKESQGPLEPEDKNNEGFVRYEKNFLNALWKIDPDWAASVGNHTNDSVLLTPSEQRKKMLDLAKLHLDSLNRYPENELSTANRMDYSLIQNFLRSSQWKLQQLKSYEWDPTNYIITDAFANILNNKSVSLGERVRTFNEKLAQLPAYFKDAQKQVKNPVAELTEAAITQLTQGTAIIENNFIDSIKRAGITETEQKVMTERAKAGAAAAKTFVTWLKANAGKGRSFRLGKELYEDKFQNTLQASLTSQQAFNAAVERKKALHKQAIKIARELWPKHLSGKAMPSDSLDMVAQVMEAVATQHPEQSHFKNAIEKSLPEISTFVQTKELLSVNPAEQPIVRKAPTYISNIWGAQLSGYMPYNPQSTIYYNVANVEKMDGEKPKEYLLEYNNYALQLLNIHEIVPGKFTQLTYAQKNPSLIKAVFANDAMINGWAAYAEEMMIEAGYGESSPEVKLMWCKRGLITACNAIIDYSVHTGGMTQPQAVKLLTKEAFQQPSLAENTWAIVALNSIKLMSEFTGYKEILNLRQDYKKKMADKYRIKEFHEKFLSYGNAPVKYIKEAMLAKEEPAGPK